MAKSKREYLHLVSPAGRAMYPFVHRPFKPDKGDPKFKVDVVFDIKDPRAKAFYKEIEKFHKAHGAGPKMPITVDKAEGTMTLKVHSMEMPKAVDSQKNPLNPKVAIGNDSIVRVSCAFTEYSGFGGGTTGYFNAIQVLELVEYTGGGGSVDVFEKEDGYVAGSSGVGADDDDDDIFGDSDDDKEEDGDDIPF